ncbi:MAG: hypothetical protein L0I94_02880 [Yaniella sp.]|uniref:ABC-three component system protein n=1 Tax=Yaniella sp. TaxID=2773929 RepID=UPI00264A4B9A|nr:ABC-three component system protein [Yaniella sp.]MDN6147767.1 hypothetical protein [Yaniella sp.]MDN6458171.1 hypothetical protein [Bifidobacterium crudilactis]MDN6757758.1 hypothetical protein [Yaniella sp.]
MPSGQNDTGIELVDVRKPTVLDSTSWAPSPAQVELTPEQYVSVYSDRQWEEFVLECATTLASYEKVMRSGGANDHGVDIAAFASGSGFDGPWDCYQCKHYAGSLTPGDAYPEVLKIVLGVLDGHFSWPRKYYFVAPKGYTTTLAGALNSPRKLRREMRTALTKDKSTLVKRLGDHSLEEVLAFIDGADFSGFGSIELHQLVDAHRVTRWHAARFGVALPDREAPQIPATKESEVSQRYVTQLLDAYTERHGQMLTPVTAPQDSKVGSHYQRQRIAFYTAESLRVFARESVPEKTFEELQEEILDGVIEVHDSHSGGALEKLTAVTTKAHQLSITSNGLLPRVGMRDRTGICHQLVNDWKMSWCDATAE